MSVDAENPWTRRLRRPRPRPPMEGDLEGTEPLAALHAEVVLLREENARLRGAQHQRAEIGRLLGRARALPSTAVDRDSVGDDAAQLLIEGLVIRESLLEICEEIERSMVAFEAKLGALAAPAIDHAIPPAAEPQHATGHGAGAA
jgi:hypothetical protein